MTASRIVCNRSRPLLGTFFNIRLESEDPSESENDLHHWVNAAFAEADRLESIFSPFKGTRPETPEFSMLWQMALTVSEISGGAFTPLTPENHTDLRGIAKGYIVDQVAQLLRAQGSHHGVVNAGGDMAFFNRAERLTDLRLGPVDKPVIRRLSLPADCVASSSPSVSQANPNSSTQYYLPLRPNLNHSCTATVIASSCAIADALTKAALFGEPARIRDCANRFNAQILLFDAEGELIESYGDL